MKKHSMGTAIPHPSAVTKEYRILFANVPADGHFNPLTGLAKYLQKQGHDVRWYSSAQYGAKLQKMHIPHYPFVKAMDPADKDVDQLFPERASHKGTVAKLNFDLINFFILRSTEYFEDIKNIYDSFPFDIVIADNCFSAIPLVKEKLDVPVVAIGVLPLVETSEDLAPCGLGMMPSSSFFGKVKQDLLRFVADNILFRKPNQLMRQIMRRYDIKCGNWNAFDLLVKKSSLLLQSGTPGFEYKRSDMGKNIRFIGPLLPLTQDVTNPWFDERLNRYEKVIVVTQGTVERDVEKLLVPTLEAFKGSEDCLVVATTGGSQTAELKKRYPHNNLIIEDFIPFEHIMPYADVYVTNGGYGGVMLGIQNQLPLVVAGVHEGKNEINARIGYFKLGINLGTETPLPMQVRGAVEKVLTDVEYKRNILALAKEFEEYDSHELCEMYIDELVEKKYRDRIVQIGRDTITIY
ncbi:glycosyltransferase [Foetidibacter luteolus]|uniref:glycosyltransferase n=1 Tax=Foetidibacter luteolus TaxID=2608880 RepID=UPI001F287097|nr:glycosyltransferase [Foetidibacter luteolus]